MNANRPEHRGSAFAVFNITDNLGQGLGPAIGGNRDNLQELPSERAKEMERKQT